jgi:Tol biopolymer transport system component
MSDMDTKLRERLQDLSADVPPAPWMPPEVRVRARRRVALNVSSLAVGGLLVLALAGLGVRSLLRTERETFGDTTPTPSVGRGPWAEFAGWITYTDPDDDLIWAVDPDTLKTKRVVPAVGLGAVAWSHDGTRVLDWVNPSLYVEDSTGRRVQLSRGSFGSASWSPADDRVVFVEAFPDGNKRSSSIDVVDADGSGTPRVLRMESDRSTGFLHPEWSPDGTEIAFLVLDERQLGAELWIMSADGSGARRLVTKRVGSWPAVWSPDSTTLAFSGVEGPAGGIFTVARDGTGLTRIVDRPGASSPAWSPDGLRLAFRVMPDDQLYVVDRDGTDLRPLGVFASKDSTVLWMGDGGGSP